MDQIREAYDQVILEEGRLGTMLVAGAIAASGIGLLNHFSRVHPNHQEVEQSAPVVPAFDKQASVQELSSKIKSKYKHVDKKLADQVAHLAIKHEHPEFPKAKDILSIAGIESSFNPNAKSGLKKDPARGLTQIRPKVWGLKPGDLKTPEDQIKKSVDILSSYHQKLGNKEDAIHAYNVGITNLRKGKGLNPGYVEKFKKEREHFE